MLPKTSEYALRAVVWLARESCRTESAENLAKHTKVPRRYLHKVLQDLVGGGLVRSQPGPGGGYTLARSPESITILDVVSTVAPLERIRSCPLGLPSHTSLCPLHSELDQVYAAVESALGRVTIAKLLRSASPIIPLCEVKITAAPTTETGERKMSTISIQDTVGDIVARRPTLAHAFEVAGVDYCCGGQKTLDEACRESGLDPQAFVATLEDAASKIGNDAFADAAAMTLTELADHIEQTHHAYLRDELPRLDLLTGKVVNAHGTDDARLGQVRETFLTLNSEMLSHMMKEEQILFPLIRKLDANGKQQGSHCGPIANPIRQMGLEHHDAGAALKRMRTLTDEFTPPDWACPTYRAMLDSLSNLEIDMHQHVHKEDNVLFPRAIKRQAELAEQAQA